MVLKFYYRGVMVAASPPIKKSRAGKLTLKGNNG